LPPKGIEPPLPGNWKPGPASRPSEMLKLGESLWNGTREYRWYSGDKRHNPHWDYNPHNTPNSMGQNIPHNGYTTTIPLTILYVDI
jgi:hypothetical protein